MLRIYGGFSTAQDDGIETDQSESELIADESDHQTEETPAHTDVPDVPEQMDESAEQQDQTNTPAQNEEMMNLFVKIPREQRVALECHKNETGESVGNVLNRLIDSFLEFTREGNLPDGYEKTVEKYCGGLHPLDTTASAKIPSRTNQELNDYISGQFESRNTIIAALVDMELNKQEMNEDQEQDSGMGMTM